MGGWVLAALAPTYCRRTGGALQAGYGLGRARGALGGLVTCASQAARLAHILTLLSLLLVSCGVGTIRCSSTTTVHDNSTDITSLLDFKWAITSDRRQALRSWHVGIPHCSWEGVICSLRHPGRVTELNLTGLGLSGLISHSIGNLTFLRILNLSINDFTGELPPLSRLQRLKYLHLRNNSLRGIIPDTLTNCSSLQTISLRYNLLIGAIPRDIGRLSNLVLLDVISNNLTGTIPPSLKNISQLESIYLDDNKLTGTIPGELGKLPNLYRLLLAENRLSDGIPETLYRYNQSSLQALDMSFNMLGKTLPSNFGDTLLNLEFLLLNDNNFEGHLPASLGNISGLEWLDLSFNNFVGQVPSSFGNLGLLQRLNLQQNNLSGFIPTELGGLKQLTHLYMSDNNLEGVVP
ncbi:putative receptor-like protein kinase At3g47110 [Triticum aestivum]|uniref:putative receptor-like protein kinase At3g47110 n=1 Tax=Triticum aestivum TaxID=4565 RepID=UPI001D002F6B|nr:putative receptor-like protein kinase At3g47110 [Triticum aestivum]